MIINQSISQPIKVTKEKESYGNFHKVLSGLVDCIENDKLVENNDTCMRLISEAKNYHLLPERRDTVSFVTHARCKASSTMVYIVGGEIHNSVFSNVRRFNCESNEWDEVAPMNKHRDGVGVAVYSGHIYAGGGKMLQVIAA